MVDKYKLYKSILISWGFTLMGIFNIAVLCGIAMFIAIRIRGPAVVVPILVPAMAMTLGFCLLQEAIVNLIYGARAPDSGNELDRRFQAAVTEMAGRAEMWVTPRAWVLYGLPGVKNAMTYGLPIPGLVAIGITRELIGFLNDDQLRACIGHECGHIKCRDTAVILPISFLLGLLNQLRALLNNGKSIWSQSPFTLVAGWAVYLMGKCAFAVSQFSISQEREFSADALAVLYMGRAEPVTELLQKFIADQRAAGDPPAYMFQELMTSHPGLEERVEHVEALVV